MYRGHWIFNSHVWHLKPPFWWFYPQLRDLQLWVIPNDYINLYYIYYKIYLQTHDTHTNIYIYNKYIYIYVCYICVRDFDHHPASRAQSRGLGCFLSHLELDATRTLDLARQRGFRWDQWVYPPEIQHGNGTIMALVEHPLTCHFYHRCFLINMVMDWFPEGIVWGPAWFWVFEAGWWSVDHSARYLMIIYVW